VSGKLFSIAGLIVLAGGSILFVPASPAATPQIGSTQDPMRQEAQDRMVREANKKRQQDIREDTDRLFQLATELKAAVDKSNENLLSLDVVRKADEVEKLAKKVKEKMKEAVGQPSKNDPDIKTIPPPPFPR
jgi:IMP dehydrogenase/GMP reductase